MNSKYFLMIAFFSFLASACFGQLEKTIHQTFEVTDKKTIQLDLYGHYEVVTWAGNNVLIETKVQLFNSSAAILKHFVEKDLRYQVDADTSSGETILLSSHDKKRITLRTKTGAESTELVETKVFMPENFVARDEKNFVLETKD